jgi:hypothetical protein
MSYLKSARGILLLLQTLQLMMNSRRVFLDLDWSIINCHPENIRQLEDEMIGKLSSWFIPTELNVMKQIWNVTSSDQELRPVLNVTS